MNKTAGTLGVQALSRSEGAADRSACRLQGLLCTQVCVPFCMYVHMSNYIDLLYMYMCMCIRTCTCARVPIAGGMLQVLFGGGDLRSIPPEA